MTKAMTDFKEAMPDQPIQVVRENNVRRMNHDGTVPGDIVKLEKGDTVPADIRIISANDCKFQTKWVSGSSILMTCDPSKSKQSLQDSPNVALLGYKCVDGNCLGVVIATGKATVIAEMIRNKQWPPSMN